MDGYVDQSAGDLNLCVYAGIPDIGKCVRIFEEHTEEILPGVHIHLGIVGASHFFSLRVDGAYLRMEFTELLACMEPPTFSGDALLTSLRLLAASDQSPLVLSFPPFRYWFSGVIRDATSENMKGVADFRESHRPIKSTHNPLKVSLAHDFSSSADGDSAGDNSFPPETLISAEFLRGSGKYSPLLQARFETVHTYPNEGMIVSSSSILRRIMP